MLRAQVLRHPLDELEPVLTREELLLLVEEVKRVRFDDSLLEYMLEALDATRRGENFLLGASPRAGLSLFRAAQAMALVEGRDYCVPDDLKRLAVPVLAHRVVPNPMNGTGGRTSDEVLADLLEAIPVPG